MVDQTEDLTHLLLRMLSEKAFDSLEFRKIQTKIEAVPSACWKNVIPQLFSLLSHPNLVVQQISQQISLKVLAKYTAEIVYPILRSVSIPERATHAHRSLIQQLKTQYSGM